MEDKSSKKTNFLKSFKELLIWQKSHELTLSIYDITKKLPQEERYNLISQLRRTAVSVPTNIAEGFGRRGSKNGLNFYNISESSLLELNYLIVLANDLELINQKKYEEINNKIEECLKLLRGWMKAIRNRASS